MTFAHVETDYAPFMQTHKNLFDAIHGADSSNLIRAIDIGKWLSFFEVQLSRTNLHPSHAQEPVLATAQDHLRTPSASRVTSSQGSYEKLKLAYHIASCCRERSSGKLSLDEITQYLREKAEDQVLGESESYIQRAILVHLSYLTMAFNVTVDDDICCNLTFSSSTAISPAQYTPQQLQRISARPLCKVLRGHADFLPDEPAYESIPVSGPLVDPENMIHVSSTCFNTLHVYGKVQVKWVDSIGLHLSFDRFSRQLKIFRFPSFAALHCGELHCEESSIALLARYGEPF
ncbi:hypothetical protein N7488_004805 [Penicillium malachiteum]|nr:hypothetical protein N7488_004805 [Penicillium malachiteum]